MKTIKKVLIISALILITSFPLTAQKSKINFDGLKIGKNYRVLITTCENKAGKLTAIDSNSIDIETEFNILTINKNEIEKITEGSTDCEGCNTSQQTGFGNKYIIKKEKLKLSLSTGVNLTSFGFNDGYDPGINIQLDIMKIISPNYAIRGDFQFGQNPRKKHDYFYSENNFYTHEGGDLNNYSFKFDFLLGSLRPSSVLNGYGIMGGGFNVVHESERKNSYSYQDYNYLTNEYTTQTYSYTEKGFTIGEMVLEIGGGFGVKISDRIRLFTEAQYSFPILFLGQYTEFNPLSFFYGNPTLKIGAQIGL